MTARLFQDTTETPEPQAGPVRIHFEVEGGPAGTVITDDTTGSSGRAYNSDVSRTTPDMACTIPGGSTSSSCTVTYTSNATGTNLVRAWIDHDGLSAVFDGDANEGRYAGGPTVPAKAYTTDCRDADAPGTADATCAETNVTAVPGAAEPDNTDVVEKTWAAAVGDRCLDAEPNSDINAQGTSHAITAEVTNASNITGLDDDDEFDCTGTLQQGTTVRITRTAGPAVTINGTAGDTATATTGPNGRVIFNVQCVSANCTGTNTFTLTAVGASGTHPTDTVTKQWVAAGQLTAFDVTPENDTNEVNTTHVLTCKATDALGGGVASQNCDFDVESGPNSTRVFVTGQPTGWIGECFTAADGTCTVSYTSTTTGQDSIRGFLDANGNNLWDDTFDDVVTKDWVVVGAGPSQVGIDMGDAGGGDCTDEGDLTAVENDVNTTHQICARARNVAGQVTDAPITFTIVSGPGFFTDSGTTTVNRGSTITVQASGTGEALAFLRSTQSGNTVVQACVAGTTICSSNGTKPWAAEDARNIAVTPESDTNEPGTEHQLTATVTDRFGNPVPSVNVSWAISGAGAFVNRENTTDANGTAFATITSNSEGTSTVTATISSGATDCELAAGNPSGAPAGNCADTATKTWDGDPTPDPECSDGIDNDGDGETDFPDDPGCESAADDDERDFVVPAECSGEGIIAGTDGADVLNGTAGDDVICGFGGNDTLNGLGGNDVLLGGGGDDELNGGDGADTIEGDVTAPCLQTGCAAGNDTADGGGGKDTIRGDAGNDLLLGGNKNDLIVGGQGNDTIRGQRGWDTIRGNAGDDRLVGNAGNDILQGGTGNDLARGGAGDDTIRGFVGRDNLRGGGGNDIIKGAGGRDQLRGGRGDDILDGGAGRDACFGGPGRDVLRRCE